MITESVIFYYLFYNESREKIKTYRSEKVYIRLSLLLKYCQHVQIIPANMWTHRLWRWGIIQNLLGPGSFLKDPSQPLPFSMTKNY